MDLAPVEWLPEETIEKARLALWNKIYAAIDAFGKKLEKQLGINIRITAKSSNCFIDQYIFTPKFNKSPDNIIFSLTFKIYEPKSFWRKNIIFDCEVSVEMKEIYLKVYQKDPSIGEKDIIAFLSKIQKIHPVLKKAEFNIE